MVVGGELTIWWWQFWCKGEWTPEFSDKSDWSVKIESMQEEMFTLICVSSLINWEKPFQNVNKNNFDLSVVWTSFVHHAGDLSLKPIVITAKNGLHLLIFLKSWWTLVKSESNLLLFWLGGTIDYRYYDLFIVVDHF